MPMGTGGSVLHTAYKTLTFTGASGAGQAGTSATIFTITGEVYIHALIAFCTTNLGEAAATATSSLGTTQQLTRFIGNTNSVDIDANEFWVSTTPTLGSIDLPDAMQSVIISEDEIVVRNLTQNTNAGVIEFTVKWEPISTDGSLVAA